jgi:hypothetical protein
MRKSILATCILLAALAGPAISLAQDDQKPKEEAKPAGSRSAEPIHFYRLTLIVQEVDANGKPFNSRSFVTTISTDRNISPGRIRSSASVPYPTQTVTDATSGKEHAVQIEYMKTGINFDLRNVQELGHQVSFFIDADISSPIPYEGPIISNRYVTHSNQWNAPVIVPIGKPTVILSSDALDSKGALQVVAIVVPIP